MKEYKLIYDVPANTWLESLPLGNGRMGAMVFGDPLYERIALNEDTLWSGCAQNNNEKAQSSYYYRAREFALKDKYAEAQKILDDNFTGDWNESYMPLGNLVLDFKNKETVFEYRRELLLNNAVHRVRYKQEGVYFEREYFISYPDNVFVLKLTCEKPFINCDIFFNSLLKNKCFCQDGMLFIEGEAPSHVEPDYVQCSQHVFYSEKREEQGLKFTGVISAEMKDGINLLKNDRIQVRDCSYLVLRFCAKSNFEKYNIRPCDSKIDSRALVIEEIKKSQDKSYENLYIAHVSDFNKLFSRTEFEINFNDCGEKSTFARLTDFQKTGKDDYLVELLFHYGKYLLVSGSREGTQAMNLQGIWNESLTPPWSSNYTLNINTEMNYWPAEPLNLPETHGPLLKLLEELSVSGEEVAREYYNVGGFVVHHNCDIWQHTNPVGRKEKNRSVHSFWLMASGWLCRHLYEHFEYTQDYTYLREKVFPILEKACTFYSELLIDYNGELILCPATSPENKFERDGEIVCVAKSSAMNVSVLRELFKNFLHTAELLGVSNSFTTKISEQLNRLQNIKIGDDGRILEWCEHVEEVEKRHRHLSHLYFAYPNDAAYEEKKYVEAVVKSLKYRSNEGTGWSLAWKVCLWSRLGYKEYAQEALKNQLRLADVHQSEILYCSGGGSYPNLFCAHPPFQIDGNLGVTAGILEMIVSSHNDKVFLLSALPDDWKCGKVKGIKVKGGFKIDMSWYQGKINWLNVFSDRNTTLEYVINDKSYTVSLMNGNNRII